MSCRLAEPSADGSLSGFDPGLRRYRRDARVRGAVALAGFGAPGEHLGATPRGMSQVFEGREGTRWRSRGERSFSLGAHIGDTCRVKVIRVHKSPPLEGEVAISGAKNSVLKLMAATLLAPGRHVLHNVPDISDVDTMVELLAALGVSAKRPERHVLIIDVPDDLASEAPWDLAERIRASVVLLGPLMARCAQVRLPFPGGDDFGGRPINFHLDGLSAMGAEITVAKGWVSGRVPQGRLKGANLTLEFASHTATDNLLMAAVLAKGTTVIDNAAREPEVVDLARFLSAMGAQISGAGTSRIEVEGVAELVPCEHRVISDRVEAATYMAAVGIAGGEVLVRGAQADHMHMLLEKLRSMGLSIGPGEDGIWVGATRRLNAVDIATLPYPGVATDYKPMLVAMLAVSEGMGIVTENLFFGGRFRYVDELRRMGADVWTEGHHAVVRGVDLLQGATVVASDVRAGAALVLAGLAAEGETIVTEVEHIERGYDAFVDKMAALGAPVAKGE